MGSFWGTAVSRHLDRYTRWDYNKSRHLNVASRVTTSLLGISCYILITDKRPITEGHYTVTLSCNFIQIIFHDFKFSKSCIVRLQVWTV